MLLLILSRVAACSTGCTNCSVAGAGKCDVGHCMAGYSLKNQECVCKYCNWKLARMLVYKYKVPVGSSTINPPKLDFILTACTLYSLLSMFSYNFLLHTCLHNFTHTLFKPISLEEREGLYYGSRRSF